MAASPTSRTLKWLRDHGWTAGVVERFNSFTKRRHDLLGIIDIVALCPHATGIVGIQATSGSNHAARRVKSLAEPNLAKWLGNGAGYEIHSWSKKGARGKAKRWTVRQEIFTLADGQIVSREAE